MSKASKKISSFVCIILFVCILTFCLWNSCAPKPAPAPPTPVPDEARVPEQPDSTLFLMDVSISMKGYFGSGDSRLLGVVGSYLNLPKTTSHIYWYGVEATKGVEAKDFGNITQNSIKWSNESNITAMLQFMVDKSPKYDLCVLLTDGILSGSDEQIKKSVNRKYNIEKREWMSGIVKRIFQKAEKDSLAALVVMYEAKFNGHYSCYDNKNVYLNDKTRPYYIIAVGKWPYVKYVENQLTDAKATVLNKPYKYYAFFGDEETYKNVTFSFKSGIKPQDNNGGKLVIKEKSGQVVLTSDITTLPDYMKCEDYWQKNLQLFVYDKQEKELKSDKYSISLDGDECSLTVNADQLVHRNLTIKLNYERPGWIKQFSDDDDSDIMSNPRKMSKTFNLEYLTQGFDGLQNSDLVIEQTLKFQ